VDTETVGCDCQREHRAACITLRSNVDTETPGDLQQRAGTSRLHYSSIQCGY